MKHIPALDGLRGVAALCVLLTHAWRYLPVPLPLAAVGMDLFFPLSGWLVYGGLCEASGAPGWGRAYWIRRVARILPLYLLVLAASAVVTPADAQVAWWTYFAGVANFLPHDAHGVGIAVTWSLSVEEQAYGALFLAVALLPAHARIRALLAVVVLCPLGRALTLGLPQDAAYYWTTGHLDGIALGALARGAFDADPRTTIRVARGAAPVLGALALVNVAHEMIAGHRVIGLVAQETILPAGGAALIVLLSDGVLPRVGAVLASRPAVWLGGVSYGLYLLHPWAILLVDAGATAGTPWGRLLEGSSGRLAPALARVGLVLLYTLPVAWLAHRGLADPIQRLGRRVAKARRAHGCTQNSKVETVS